MDSIHCYYYVIRTMANRIGIVLTEPEIFHLLGGYHFEIVKRENLHYPLIQISSSQVDDSLFETHTHLRIEAMRSNDIDASIDNLIEISSSNFYQAVLTNCFYLPYDSINHNRNNGNHYLIIKDYDPHKQCFTITDYKYEHTEIHVDDLKAAMTTLPEKEIIIKSIRKKDSDLHRQELADRVRHVILENARQTVEITPFHFDQLKREIKRVDGYEPPFRSLAYLELIRSIKLPNGPVASQHYLFHSLPSGWGHSLTEYIEQSKYLWERFCMDLYKSSYAKEAVPMDERLDKLMDLELNLNMQLLRIAENSIA
jgi:hypothetical protein